MVVIKFDLLLLLIIFHESHCERRIVGGQQVAADKSYVVYFVKARISGQKYDSWLCGGAIVSKEFIITSAACVTDVQYIYAIAGYRRYVDDRNLERDECTKEMKKKIVYTCVPLAYEFDYDKIEKWAHIDIALAKVESPYNFDDARYQIMCSYAPSIIPVNYDPKPQENDVDAIVFGWGHVESWRQSGDRENYNQEYLRYAATTLYDNNKCKQEYKDYPDFLNTIEKYMLCSLEPGLIDDFGLPFTVNTDKPQRTSCITQKQKLMGLQGVLCEGEVTHPAQDPMDQVLPSGTETRKHISLKESNNNVTNKNVKREGFVNGIDIANRTDIDDGTDIVNGTDSVDKTGLIYKPVLGNISDYLNRTYSRRNGICQNDHGGPLVTWVGKREVLIGVASVFKITEENKCTGPYLYTSTRCSGAFIGCMLDDVRAKRLKGARETVDDTRKALLCDSPPSERGFDTIESYISWKDHPSGPADNESPALRDRLEPKKKDRYASFVKDDSKEDIVNPFKDRNTQQLRFPKYSPKHDKQETNDRFSLNIGIPPRRKPPQRKRPPPEIEPPPIIRHPLKMEPSPILRPSPETKPPLIMRPRLKMEPPPILRPSPGMEPPPVMGPPPIINRPPPIVYGPPHIINRAPQKMEHSPIVNPPPKMAPLPYEGIPDFESEEAFLKELFDDKPNSKPSSIAQSEFKIRFQNPLR